ncbi:MAG: OmpA family protein [Acidobacteriia bacterium]|nr:OmpA family protein [Terriglobia bacterium]
MEKKYRQVVVCSLLGFGMLWGSGVWGQQAPANPNPPTPPGESLPARRPAGPKPGRQAPLTLTCQAEKTHVLPGEIVQLVADAQGFDPESLRYVWGASSGVLNGFGNRVTYDTAGLIPGVYELVVDVTDCYDEKEHCSTSITIDSVCPPNVLPTIQVQPEKASVLEGGLVDLECIGHSTMPGGVVYQWSSTVGKLEGSEGHMRLDTSLLKGPLLAQVKCVVSDKCGSVNAVIPVAVTALPKRKPEPINCLSGDFPYDSSRINNVDKACLDDLALKMQNDSSGSLVITGYAAPNEHNRNALALSRAENAKEFLLKTHRLEARRIQTRAAAEGSLLAPTTDAAGRRKNRGLQITYLPSGSAAN